MTIENPRLLLVDSYDSFTHNLAALFRQAIPNIYITIIKNDDLKIEDLRPYLSHFSAIIVGPGPGSPENIEDIGVVRDLWKLKDQDVLPIFGVCLGLQSLAVENKAQLKRLNTVKHGQISLIQHRSTDIFEKVGPINAVRYHSLHVKLGQAGDIEELAWADDEENGRVVMAVRHKNRPFWAVQYHPESVCTEGGGIQVVQNFWSLAQSWTNTSRRRISPWNDKLGSIFGTSWPYPSTLKSSPIPNNRTDVITSSLKRTDLSVVDICEIFGASDESSRFALLESASQPGRFSIVGCLSASTLHIKYHVGDSSVSLTKEGQTSDQNLGSQDIWSWLGRFMQTKIYAGNPELPFWGGLVGFLSYELGVKNLHVPLRRDANPFNEKKHPDINLVFIERSIVADSQTGRTYVQSLVPNDRSWVVETVARLEKLNTPSYRKFSSVPLCKTSIVLPNKDQYISNIKQAKEHLFAGDSYELCLTAPTRISITLPSCSSNLGSSSWERYKRLRKANPAPHSAYLRLHPSTLLSSSPERFLSYSRAPGSVCQLRPIKGTVRKALHITRAVAERALIGNPKEVAENLMIVDLIRHDLHGVVGEDVVVKQFCSMEEYETVWQLVSVIEGRLSDDAQSWPGAENQLGWKVLKESLPPGSMTGAPKKRSVEILQNLEGEERGIYSGVFGYWCVGGGGDWSVTIRSCFKFEESNGSHQEDGPPSSEEWVIGAGGAITALSDPESEWEEMVTKLQSVLRAFGAMDSDFT